MITTAFLKRKLSPDADPEKVEELKKIFESTDLTGYRRQFKGKDYIVLTPLNLFEDLYGREANNVELRDLARSLLALYWERSALHGNTVYIKEIGEYHEFKY